jgi:hypothetical protein
LPTPASPTNTAVLALAQQDLDDEADLPFPSDHGHQRAVARQGREIPSEPLEQRQLGSGLRRLGKDGFVEIRERCLARSKQAHRDAAAFFEYRLEDVLVGDQGFPGARGNPGRQVEHLLAARRHQDFGSPGSVLESLAAVEEAGHEIVQPNVVAREGAAERCVAAGRERREQVLDSEETVAEPRAFLGGLAHQRLRRRREWKRVHDLLVRAVTPA